MQCLQRWKKVIRTKIERYSEEQCWSPSDPDPDPLKAAADTKGPNESCEFETNGVKTDVDDSNGVSKGLSREKIIMSEPQMLAEFWLKHNPSESDSFAPSPPMSLSHSQNLSQTGGMCGIDGMGGTIPLPLPIGVGGGELPACLCRKEM